MRSAAAVLFVLSLALPVAAQEQQPRRAPQSSADVNVDRLPLNLNRIHRQLRHTTDLEERDGLNLRYRVQIYGTAPPIQIFGEDSNLVNGPVPYGAPTHREIVNHITPQEFRAPAADFSALIRWLNDRNKKK
jgi:hypothetical protein